MPRVVVVFTGGTISTAFDPVAGGNVPVLDGAALLDRTPGLGSIADVVAVDRGRTPASHFTFPMLFDIGATIREAAADPAVDGVVVVQGTDTIEETAFFWDLVCEGPKPVVVTGAMRASDAPGFDGPANLRDAVRVAADPRMAGTGVVVCLGGSIEPADDALKMHTTSLTTFASPNGGSLGRVDGGEVTVLRRRAGRRSVAAATRAAERVHLITATVAMDGALLDAAVAAGADGVVVAATGAGNTDPRLLAAAVRAMGAGIPVVARHVAARPARPDPRTRSRVAARRGSARARCRSGTCARTKARVALALGLGAGLDRRWTRRTPRRPGGGLTRCRSRPSSPAGSRPSRATRVRLGRGDRHPRRPVAFAGSEVDLETRADPFTERIVLEPDEVAIPGLTDAHLHLAQARRCAARHVDLTDAATLDDGLVRDRRGASSDWPDPDAWLEGHGWDADRWGGWPTRRRPRDRGARVVAVPSGRTTTTRCWRAGRRSSRPGSTLTTPDPAGGVIRRDADGAPEGCSTRWATRRVVDLDPAQSTDELEAAIVATRRSCSRSGSSRCHDPGGVAPDPDLAWAYPGLRPPVRDGRRCRSGSTPRCATTASRPRSQRGLRSGAILGADPDGRARSAGRSASPTARSGRGPRRCWPTSSPSPTGRCPRNAAAGSG